jgi:sensor histidine kinase regulating citrate/malate metabolism
VIKINNNLKVVVKDNGIGMDLKKYKVNSADPLEVKNLEPNSKGLGIFLAKHLTETLEGCLKFVSKVDCGTKVILKFDHVG